MTEESKEIEKAGVQPINSQDGEDIETTITENFLTEETSVQENQNRAHEISNEQRVETAPESGAQEENAILEVKTVQKNEENTNDETEVQLGDNTPAEWARGENAVGQAILSEDGTPGEDGNNGFPGGAGKTGENGLNGINGTGNNLVLPSEGLINIDMPGISVKIDLSKLNNTIGNLINKRNR